MDQSVETLVLVHLKRDVLSGLEEIVDISLDLEQLCPELLILILLFLVKMGAHVNRLVLLPHQKLVDVQVMHDFSALLFDMLERSAGMQAENLGAIDSGEVLDALYHLLAAVDFLRHEVTFLFSELFDHETQTTLR